MKKALIFLLVISYSGLLADNDTLRPRYGVFAGYGINLHTAAFSKLPGVPNCCPEFESGSGSGISGGLLFEYPFTNSFLLNLRTGIIQKNGLLEKTEPEAVSVNLTEVDGEFTHSIDAGLMLASFQPMLSYRLLDNLYINAGAGAGILLSKTYEQKEEITKPTDQGVFMDTGTRRRNEKSGDISETSSFLLDAVFGLAYELPLNSDGTIKLAPEVFYDFGISSILNNEDWNVSSLRFGLSLKYSPFETIQIMRDYIRIDTIEAHSEEFAERRIKQGSPFVREYKRESTDTLFTINEYLRTDTLQIPIPQKMVEKPKEPKRPKPELNLDLYAIDDSGNRVESENLFIKVQTTTEVYPLLPYIFFEQSKNNIPVRYGPNNEVDDFNTDNLEPSPVVYHQNTLRIIGMRLVNTPDARLYINGYVDPATEQGNFELADKRAENVMSYLINKYNINPERLVNKTSENRIYPPELTKTQNEQGYAENRRVELSSNKSSIFSPVPGYRYLREEEKNFTGFGVEPGANLDVLNWQMEVLNGDYILEKFRGDELPVKLEYRLNYRDIEKMNSGEPVSIRFKARSEQDIHEKRLYINFDKNISKIEVNRLTLTIFEVSQSRLDSRIKSEIRNFIEGLDENSTIAITGYTDNLGDENENRKLSLDRAKQVESYIKSISPRANIRKVEGIGSGKMPPGVKSYLHPEERFMSRTVEILIEKPLTD